MASRPGDETPSGQIPTGQTPIGPTPAVQARRLLRSARSGCLATGAAGQPYASLVTPACMPDGSIVLLLSQLAEHTRHLMADPRCSLMVSGAAVSANPQTTPRITVTGVAEVVNEPNLKARFLAVHPYASLYADFGDFATWRIKPVAGLLVGGFARAFRLKAVDLALDAGTVAAFSALEAAILLASNRDPSALAGIAGDAGDWRMVAVDLDGFDLACGERVVRFAWPAPVTDAQDVQRALAFLAEQRRGDARDHDT